MSLLSKHISNLAVSVAIHRRYISKSTRLLGASKQGSAFGFLPSNVLPAKPRTFGLTEIRGPYYAPVSWTYLDELLSDWGEYVDGVKFAGGSFSLMPQDRMKGLIDVAHKHGMTTIFCHLHIIMRVFLVGCYVSTGGFIERVLSSSAGDKHLVEKYLQACKNSG